MLSYFCGEVDLEIEKNTRNNGKSLLKDFLKTQNKLSDVS